MKTHPEENLFTSLIEKLLAGQFICRYSDELGFEQLERESYRTQINHYLEKIGRTLATTGNRGTYYAVYTSVQSTERRQSIRTQFREVVNDLEPLSRWLKLVMSALSRDSSIQPGDILRQSDLLNALENSQPLVDDLLILTRVGSFQTKKNLPSEKISVILDKLTEKGYFTRQPNGMLFTATGKWEYFYEVADFIATHEKFDRDVVDEEQVELPL
jgi:hypothetical protein